MNRVVRLFLGVVLAAAWLLLPTSVWAQNTAADGRPDVLFIMADDCRPELASYGSAAITPHLNRLARRGVQFDRAYCQQALCNPSRSSLLTGRRPDSLRVWDNSTHFRTHHPDLTTLPQWFKDHGYDARCVGKIFHNWHTSEKGDPRSWSGPEFLHFAQQGANLATMPIPLPPNLASPAPRAYGTSVPAAPLYECRDVPDEAYYDGRVAAEAVRLIQEAQDRPLFLAVGFWKPHAPFNAPKKYWDLYDRATLPTFNPARPVAAPELAFHDNRELLGIPPDQVELTPAQVAEVRHGYFANISYLDAQLGKVLDALERSGRLDRTIILFVGDHGYHLGEHGLWAKNSNFELDSRVPCLIAPPQCRRAGERTAAIVELIDLFPTLVELCGLPMPDGLEGLSLVPVLSDTTHAVKPAAFTQHPRPAYFDREPGGQPAAMGVSVRTAGVRYTEWRDWRDNAVLAREIYDHGQESDELVNRIDDPEWAAARTEAEAVLEAQFPRSIPNAGR
jgi:iduronate 2-sulfatase